VKAVAVLFLKETIFSEIKPWSQWKEEKAYSEMIVPLIEAGVPEPLLLEHVSEIFTVAPLP
jgi:hypothetical protein